MPPHRNLCHRIIRVLGVVDWIDVQGGGALTAVGSTDVFAVGELQVGAAVAVGGAHAEPVCDRVDLISI
jgi:hypothetical protein